MRPPARFPMMFWGLLALAVGVGLVCRCACWRQVYVEGWAMCYGPDPYYHLRRIQLALANGLIPPTFDSYYEYPEGVECYTPHLLPALTALAVRAWYGNAASLNQIAHIFVWLGPLSWLIVAVFFFFLCRSAFGTHSIRTAVIGIGIAAILPPAVMATRLGNPDTQCIEAIYCLGLPAVFLALGRRVSLGSSLAGGAFLLGGLFSWPGVLMYALLYAGGMLGLRALWCGTPLSAHLTIHRRALRRIYAVAAVGVLLYSFAWPAGSTLDRVGFGMASVLVACAVAFAIPAGRRLSAWLAPVFLCFVIFVIARLTGARTAEDVRHWAGTVTELEPLLGRNGVAWLRLVYGFTPLFPVIPVLLLLWIRKAVHQSSFLDADPEETLSMGVLTIFAVFALLSGVLLVKQAHVLALYAALLLGDGVCQLLQVRNRVASFVPVGLALALCAPVWAVFQPVQRFSHPLSARWQCFFYLRDQTPPAGDPLRPSREQRPAYGVLTSFWDDGHFLTAVAERPAIASGLSFRSAGNRASAEFLFARSETEALALLDGFRARYYLWSYNVDILPTYARWLGVSGWSGVVEDDGHFVTGPELFDLFQTQLVAFDGSAGNYEGRRWPASQHLRLLFEQGDLLSLRGKTVPRFKLFERVAGCTLHVVTFPRWPVRVELALESNLGRRFTYVSETEATAQGTALVVVPYATVGAIPPGTRPASAYRVTSGDRTGTVAVDESDVIEGRTLSVLLAQAAGQ